MYSPRHHICVTADKTTLVGISDHRAAYLLCAPGGVVPDSVLAQYDVKTFDASLDAPGSDTTDKTAAVEAQIEAAAADDHVIEKPQDVRATKAAAKEVK